MRKFLYFGKSRSSISLEVAYTPMAQVGLDFGEDITLSFGFLVQFYISLNVHKINSWLYRHKLQDRALKFDIWFKEGVLISINLFAKTMESKKGDWKWFWNMSDILKGKARVSKKVIEEKDILVPMPEKSYKAHAILADWTWHYPRWFSLTIRRCEIELEEGIPHAGKGENSYDCGDDATFGVTTGKIKNIAVAVGNLVGSTLDIRVRYGGWKDWNFKRKPKK